MIMKKHVLNRTFVTLSRDGYLLITQVIGERLFPFQTMILACLNIGLPESCGDSDKVILDQELKRAKLAVLSGREVWHTLSLSCQLQCTMQSWAYRSGQMDLKRCDQRKRVIALVHPREGGKMSGGWESAMTKLERKMHANSGNTL